MAKTTYLATIGALMYMANCNRLTLYLPLIYLATFNVKPTKCHWNGVKHILQRFKGMEDLGFSYSFGENNNIKEYKNKSYLSDPHQGKS